MDIPKLDRTKLRIVKQGEPDDWVDYWLTKTPDERLAGIEVQRKVLYGYDSPPRLQRVLAVVGTKTN